MNKVYFFSFFICVYVGFGQPQSNPFSITQLDRSHGLSNSSINTIFQDSDNLLWIGTWDGLNRYDGNNFKVYRPKLNDSNSLTNQVILKIEEDNHGYLWVLTMHGLNKYDRIKDNFQQFYFAKEISSPFSEFEYNMAVNKEKTVFCAVKDWGIGYFDGNEFKNLFVSGLPNETIKKMSFLNSGELVLLYSNNRMYSLKINTDENGDKKAITIEKLFEEVDNFEIVNGDSIYTSLISKAIVYCNFQKQKNNLKSLEGSNIVSKTSKGIILKTAKEYIEIDGYQNTLLNPWLQPLNDLKITSLYQGTDKIVWVGTDGDGIFKIHPKSNPFNLIDKTIIPDIKGGIVRAFLDDGQYSFWVATKGKGLFRFPKHFYKSSLNHPENYIQYNNTNSGINNAVFSLCKGNDNLLFIGSDGPGISVYDLKQQKLFLWSDIIGAEQCDYFNAVYTIYQDEDGVLWVGTNGYGLIRLKIKRSNKQLKIIDFKQFLVNKGANPTLSSNIVFAIVPKSDSELWVGTRLGGLNLYDKENNSFRVYRNQKGEDTSLINDDVLCLHIDKNDRLWVGTSFGLSCLNNSHQLNNLRFINYTKANGLLSNTIHGIVSDEASNLWLSTNFGLSRLIKNSSKFTNYTQSEGLQNNEFADGALYRSPYSNYIFAGGIKGFNYFYPSKIEESTEIPNLFIDKMSGQDEKMSYLKNLVITPNSNQPPAIILKYNQNFFDIDLSVLTFINADKCQLSYKLENFNDSWNKISSPRTISFTNVPSGNYMLWIKWSNTDGVWTLPVKAINIKVEPIIWQTDTAYLIYVLLFILFTLFIWSYFNKQYKLKKNIILQKQEEEIHHNRITFFTNIAHEFQTPLTLIVSPIQKLAELSNLNEKSRRYIKMIEQNASRLLFLTQQLLEFRKAEEDHLGVLVKKLDLVNLLEQIAELFDEWALQKNITFEVIIPSKLMGWFDKDKIEKIIFNLLSNAFKYTPEGGFIKLVFTIEGEAPLEQLKITIKNSGKGIPKSKIDTLFNRFTSIDEVRGTKYELFRTGIGLAYINKLVQVLRGNIKVKSNENKRTTFIVLLPCSEAFFSEIEKDKYTDEVFLSQHLKNIINTPILSNEIPSKHKAINEIISEKKKILIVEDKDEMHTFLNELLGENYSIIKAYDGIEALKILENQEPEIIISDVMMPKMDGVQLCNKVKNNVKTSHIPFIILTAGGSLNDRIKGLESGANSYISKPFHPHHLLVRIEKLLEEREVLKKYFKKDIDGKRLYSLPIKSKEKEFIRKVINVIRANIDSEKLQSKLIEKEVGVSGSQLYRKVKEITGLSQGDLIRTVRLSFAAELLRSSALTVSEICYKSGFNNRSYFYREFKKAYNLTPKNYQIRYNPNLKHKL